MVRQGLYSVDAEGRLAYIEDYATVEAAVEAGLDMGLDFSSMYIESIEYDMAGE